MDEKSPVRAAIRRYYVPNAIYFIVAVTQGRRPIFAQPANLALLRATMRRVKALHPFAMRAYALMPEHLHLLIFQSVDTESNRSTVDCEWLLPGGAPMVLPPVNVSGGWMPTVYLGLGGNLGDREANLREACRHLEAGGVRVDRCSSLYETEPWGVADQPRFLNAVCCGQTDLSPAALLALAKQIEQDLGRRPTVRYGPRPVDIDILLYGDTQLVSPELTIPHPRLAERAFVLVPLVEIAPEVAVPGTGRSVRELLQALGPVTGVQRVGVFGPCAAGAKGQEPDATAY